MCTAHIVARFRVVVRVGMALNGNVYCLKYRVGGRTVSYFLSLGKLSDEFDHGRYHDQNNKLGSLAERLANCSLILAIRSGQTLLRLNDYKSP